MQVTIFISANFSPKSISLRVHHFPSETKDKIYWGSPMTVATSQPACGLAVSVEQINNNTTHNWIINCEYEDYGCRGRRVSKDALVVAAEKKASTRFDVNCGSGNYRFDAPQTCHRVCLLWAFFVVNNAPRGVQMFHKTVCYRYCKGSIMRWIRLRNDILITGSIMCDIITAMAFDTCSWLNQFGVKAELIALWRSGTILWKLA